MYSECSCIHGNGTAVAGLCDMECSMIYPFLVYIGIWAFLESVIAMPTLIVLMRYVKGL